MTRHLDAPLAALLRDVAETVVLPRYQHLGQGDVIDKAVDDLVTIADTEAEERLTEALAQILPEAAIVGEEAAHADPAVLNRLSGLCWIIDPIDGTNNFAAGRPPFGIMVALADAGEAIAGWIYDPLRQRLCTAHKGQGAFIDGERVTARTTGASPPVAAISVVFLDAEERARIAAQVAPHYTLVDIPRCAAEQYPRIITGINDVSIFGRTYAWDHAAGVLLVNEAGGFAARPDGRAYRVDEDRLPGLVAASSRAHWDALVARL